MLADGILYFGLAVWGIRCGWHWARVTFLTSSIVGFFSFFLFLGFGYFDPFHAFVTAIVFQFVMLAVHSTSSNSPQYLIPDWRNDRAWRAAQWGQLLYVVHGAAVIVAGLVISSFGVTSVFVQDDLDFMQTTIEALAGANSRLIPLIAHDRASFGGMLISCGVATLLTSLWGFRRGAAWVWWSLTLAGMIAYSATIAVHLAVGYTSFRHLLPAYGGLAAIAAGSLLTAPFLLRQKKLIGT
jgi:dihydroorotate dehydrogenase